jgi:hypothetical protein
MIVIAVTSRTVCDQQFDTELQFCLYSSADICLTLKYFIIVYILEWIDMFLSQIFWKKNKLLSFITSRASKGIISLGSILLDIFDV